MKIKHYSTNDRIEILGHIFNGLEEIENAVEIETRVSNAIGERYIRQIHPENVIPGIHILKLYEPYPCFDSSDFMYENRRYCNYFFSKKPFTTDDITRIANTRWHSNYCLVNENMNKEFLPASYYGGTTGDDLIVAK